MSTQNWDPSNREFELKDPLISFAQVCKEEVTRTIYFDEQRLAPKPSHRLAYQDLLYYAKEHSTSSARVARPQEVDAIGCIPRAFGVLIGIPKCKAC